MAGCYLATNLITSDATITPATEDENYPVSNVYDRMAAKLYRTESTVALAVEFDLLGAVSADTFAIVNHNFTQAAVVTLRSGAASPPAAVVAVLTWREFDMWVSFASQSKRYWSVTVSDSNPEALSVGQIMLGNRTAFPRARRIAEGYEPARQREVVGGETYSGVIHKYYLFDRLSFNPSFRIASDAERDVFSDMDRELYGNVYPFLYVPDSSAAGCHYVRKDPEFETKEIAKIGSGDIAYDLTLNLVEESRGLNILE